jgi:hypothetical protein
MSYNARMSDRVLDIELEPNLLLDNESSADFWEQYFELQQLASAVDMADGRFSVHVVNKATGEEMNFSSIKLAATGDAIAN